MSDTTSTDLSPQDDVQDDAEHEYDAHTDHKPDSYYVKVAAVLALITALEVSLSYIDIGALFLPTMLILMATKFVMVVSIFMHLKFDNRIFSWCFYTGLILALLVYAAALATFQFFDTP
ncbi:MAG: cytochrome C oxidase subunit IV family protein [Ilumatobacteraceae bacterium]